MDLDDIDQWSRELLQKEARKRGIVNASLYSRPELIKLILRHDYPDSPKSVRDAARLLGGLFGSAKDALLHGFSSAAKARQKIAPPEPPYAPRQSWGDAPSAADLLGDSKQARAAAPAGPESESRQSAPQPYAAEPAWAEVPGPAELEGVAALAEAAKASKADATRIDATEELRPPARGGSSPLELAEALRVAEASATSRATDEASVRSARVDPNPELRPPAAAGFPPHEVNLRVSTPPPRGDAAATASLEFSIPSEASAGVPAERELSPWASIPPDDPAVMQLKAATARRIEPPRELEPLRPGTDELRYGPHPEHGLFLRWQVTPDAVARARLVLGSPGELALRLVAVRVDPRAVVHTEILDHGPIEATGDWTAPVPPSAARYVGAIGVRTAERFVSIVHAES